MELLPTYCLHSHYRVRTSLIRESSAPGIQINTSEQAVSYFRKKLIDKDREYMLMIGVNANNIINIDSVLHIGSARECIVSPIDVFKPAMLACCTAVIIAHNHPSGNANPSREDELITDKLYKAGRILDIMLMDHIIIGDDNYFSFKDEGLLE